MHGPPNHVPKMALDELVRLTESYGGYGDIRGEISHYNDKETPNKAWLFEHGDVITLSDGSQLRVVETRAPTQPESVE